MPVTPLYDVRGLKHGYNRKFLLNIPQFTIEQGNSIGIMGPNGSGKSTLLKMLAFLETPAEGEIKYRGLSITSKNAASFREVTFLLQDPYLLKRSVFENVAYGLRMRGEKDKIRERVREALEWIELPPDTFEGRKWFELSGGEAKRVALASRLVLLPDVLILDEPTASIDRQSASAIKDAVGFIRARHPLTLIIASHDTVWLRDITTRVIKIHEGKIAGYDTDNIIHGPWNAHPDGLWQKTLADGQAISATRPPDTFSTATLDPSSIIISLEQSTGISAQNVLRGVISAMSREKEPDKIRIEVDVSDMQVLCMVTGRAAETLKLLPGKEVWIVFKASSLSWH